MHGHLYTVLRQNGYPNLSFVSDSAVSPTPLPHVNLVLLRTVIPTIVIITYVPAKKVNRIRHIFWRFNLSVIPACSYTLPHLHPGQPRFTANCLALCA